MTGDQHIKYCNGGVEVWEDHGSCDNCGFDTRYENNWNTEDYGDEPNVE